MNKILQVARYSKQCTVLGPGKRGVVWVQGCNRHCTGCTAPETWDKNGGFSISVEYLANIFVEKKALEGLTFSGGEPFLQAEALTELIRTCRQKRPEFTFLAFTGFTLEELMEDARPERLAFLAELDVLIDGPYRENEHENLLWRGSRNQRVWFLTPHYRQDWESRVNEYGVHLEIEMDAETLHVMGIPPRCFRGKFEEFATELGLIPISSLKNDENISDKKKP